MRQTMLCLLAGAALGCATAQAGTLTFESQSTGFFVGSATESGYTFTNASGTLLVWPNGNPGKAMEGTVANGNAELRVTRAGPVPYFTFESLDYAAYSLSNGGTQSLTVQGYLLGNPVGSDSWVLTGSNVPSNWTTELPTNLDAVVLDELRITLLASLSPTEMYQAVDNIVLADVASLPEPGGLTLLMIGLIGMGFTVHSKLSLGRRSLHPV